MKKNAKNKQINEYQEQSLKNASKPHPTSDF